MLDRLRNLDLERLDVDEAVALVAFGQLVRSQYDGLSLEAPEWLDSRLRELKREIRTRNQDAIEKRLREAKLRREALKPREERRAELDDEILKLEQQLGVSRD